ncbi:juvenile hormone esterase-like [Anopheles stephensi]|uniref:juvenile hormone esterase-like n=1 Tax=Anopheles stephensi TaxID=30069 RepID=UPI00165883E5|nr:juvenile hormone esterase-like [Anopheles stephensi]
MWLCAAVFVGCLYTSLVQAICQVQLDRSTTGIGVQNTTFRKTPYCAYLGVRYGKPPVGKLRFRHSVVHQPSGLQNYTAPGSVCPQFRDTLSTNVVLGEEDCLFANIYSPSVGVASEECTPKAHPVLVFVHGGSYQVGDGERDINGVDLLVDSGILVITFNYRLNMVGFLKSEAHNISGNYGLKDQTTLLRWVQRYITHFGGDPDQVTLMGQSAGGSAVTHHLYIQQSKDLFHRLIALSGSLIAPWSFLFDYQYCTERYMSDLKPHSLEQLQEMDFHDFFLDSEPFRYWFPFASMGTPCFIPVQEQDEIHHDNFTVHMAHESVLNPPVTQVPMLLSETGREFEDLVKRVDRFYFFPNIPLNWTMSTGDAFVSTVNNFAASLVGEGHAKSIEEVIQQIASYGNMKYPMRRLAKHLAQSMNSSIHPIYYMRFEYDGRFGKSKNDFYRDDLENPEYGAMHGDELGYIFTPDVIDKALAAPDEYREEWRIHDRTVELIANFIKRGNPTPTGSELTNITSWIPLNENNSSNTYMNMDRTLEVRQFEEDRYYQYWDKVYNCLYYNVCDEIFEVELVQ